jgi:hypothetical protein
MMARTASFANSARTPDSATPRRKLRLSSFGARPIQ